MTSLEMSLTLDQRSLSYFGREQKKRKKGQNSFFATEYHGNHNNYYFVLVTVQRTVQLSDKVFFEQMSFSSRVFIE